MLSRIFPFLTWFKDYDRGSFQRDFVSGLTVALVLIPQSMAYAQLAGLPPYYGLYASFLPPMIAALFGSSRQLATGPVAVVSLMTSASLAPLATTGSAGYIAYAIMLALMVGVIQLAIGLLRLGLVVNLLSHPVVNGFTNAAALIIASSQLSKIFGIHVDTAEHHYETIIAVVRAAIHFTHWPTVGLAVLAFAIMYTLKRLVPRVPCVLVAVVVTTVMSATLGFKHDLTVDMSAIRTPEVVEEIEQFNKQIDELEKYATERTELRNGPTVEEGPEAELARLRLAHELEVVDFKLASARERAHIARENLRSCLLERVPDPADPSKLEFHCEKFLPEGLKTDGRTWRLKVGNGRLDTKGLTVVGGGEVVGVVPSGLPTIAAPPLDFGMLSHLLPYAAIIALLGFTEAISIAKAMAARTGQRLDPNRELIGQGLANILGAFGKSYPTSGSFSRSAVNLQAGAVSGLSSVFTSLTVVVALLFLTPLLYHLPQAVLAAVIMMAVIGLVNISGFVHTWKAQWYDGAISIITFVATLIFAPHLDRGIAVGVLLSLAVALYRSMRPIAASLSRGRDSWLLDYSTHRLQTCRFIDLIRFEGPLYFANSSYLEDQIVGRMKARKELRHIIIAAHGMNDMDASGEEVLSLIVDTIRSAGVDISFSGFNDTVMGVLHRTHLYEKIGSDHIYPTMEIALAAVHPAVHSPGEEQSCPLITTPQTS